MAVKPPDDFGSFAANRLAENSRVQIEQLKAQLDIERSRAKALDKERIAADRIVEIARRSITALPTIKPAALPPYKGKAERTKESAVLLASCWHIGETVSEQEMGGLNRYDFDVFCRRLQHVVDTVVKFTVQNLSAYEFEELHVIHTGDFVSGIIHQELLESNDSNIVEQGTLGAFVFAQALRELSAIFPRVYVTVVPGNHGRLEKQKRFKGKAQLSWDYVAYNYAACLLRDIPNIKFNIPLSFFANLQIRGWNFHISHGDTVKSWAGIPWYGINREAGAWQQIMMRQGTPLHYIVRSHFHTAGTLQTTAGQMILNGSLKGGCEYALGIPAFGDPIQLLFGVHEKHGKTWQLDINAKDATGLSRYKYDRTRALGEQLETAA